MKVIFDGKATVNKTVNNIKDVLGDVAAKIQLPEGSKVRLENVSFNVVYTVNGEDMYLTVPREVQGQEVQEIFTTMVKLDEKGNLATLGDNEEESTTDEKTLLEANGGTFEYEVIESAYNDSDLEVITEAEETSTSFVIKSYTVKSVENRELIRYYKEGRLVGERVIDTSMRDNRLSELIGDNE